MTLTRFEKEGIELVIDENGECYYPGYRSLARVCSIGLEKSVFDIQVRRLIALLLQGATEAHVFEAEILTGGGLQRATLIPRKLGTKAIQKFNPELYEQMAEAGHLVFLYQLAGYKIERKVPEVKESSTDVDVLIEQQLLTLNALVDTRKKIKDLERQSQEAVARVEMVESKILVFENRAAEAEKELKALPPATTPCPARTTRNNINTLVRGYCHTNNISHRIAWNNLYREFRDRYHFDLKTRANNRGNTSPLDIAESFNKIDELYSLAVELFA